MELPMPADAIDWVNTFACNQGMPKTLTFADHLGFELPAYDNEVNNDHNSAYVPNDDSNANSTSYDSSDG
jgi:hypothetical protein